MPGLDSMHVRSTWGWIGSVAALAYASSCTVDDRAPVAEMLPNQPGRGGGTSGDSSAMGGRGGLQVGGVPPASAGAGGARVPPPDDPSNAGAGGAGAGAEGGTGTGGAAMGAAATAGTSTGGAGAGATGGGPGGASTIIPVPSSVGEVPASVGSCPAFSACGGTLDGVWSYVSICLTREELSLDMLDAVCPGTTAAFEPGAGATLQVENGTVIRPGEALGPGQLVFTAECADSFGGCAAMADLFGPESGCSEVAAGCACLLDGSVDWGVNTFTTEGSQLSLADGRTFDYCVSGDELVYRETGSVLEGGTYTLRRD
jgi:hypothetical protein